MYNTLNPCQTSAVTAKAQHLLILAGAGSGKTRVLTQRMAYLIEQGLCAKEEFFAVTFTNKAAQEMRARLDTLLHTSTRSLWIGTFHALSHRLLRLHYHEAKLPETFQILDSDDQARLIKRLLKEMNIDETRYPAKQLQWYINSKKDEGIRANAVRDTQTLLDQLQLKVYAAYETLCDKQGLVDFAEILLRAYEMLKDTPTLLSHYQARFKHILVDEFQDTNALQYALIRLLAGEHNHLMIVGDDDQSIYGWRGARIENIQRFSTDFPDTVMIRLEQNYRSTSTILDAANALISRNRGRLGKTLWTDSGQGEKIARYEAFNDLDEARFVVAQIKLLQEKNTPLTDIAILYRSNMQSRLLEEQFVQHRIPYRIYGGLRFYDRAEVKEALAYLRLIVNHHDDTAFERIINMPPRGIGERTVMLIRDEARAHEISLWTAAEQMELPARAAESVRAFLNLIATLSSKTGLLADIVAQVITESGLIEHYRQEKGERGLSRIENLSELVSSTREFIADDPTTPILATFLSHIALESGEYQSSTETDYLQLMTLHAAKGLEFPIVFITGMEEGLFPHQLSIEDPLRMEEERRLCYVGITRARQKLFITHAESRRIYNREQRQSVSRFLRDIPEELIEEVRLQTKVTHPASVGSTARMTANDYPFGLGKIVRHPVFGEGIVLHYEGSGDHLRVQVKFVRFGTKWLALQYANLEA